MADPSVTEYHWIEEHIVNTDAYGTFAVIFGEGQRNDNSLYLEFKNISFYQNFWLKIEIRDDGSWFEISNQKLLSVPYAENVVPVGSIIPFGGSSDKIPEGWLLCDGTALDSNIYLRLYHAIEKSWGDGSNDALPETTFNIPDLRGQFLRGVDYAKGVDPDANTRTTSANGGNNGDFVGSYQTDALQQHKHSGFTSTGGYSFEHHQSNGRYPGQHWQKNSGNMLNGSISTETRPKNVYVNYIIRVF